MTLDVLAAARSQVLARGEAVDEAGCWPQHAVCRQRLGLEPPRHCPACGRRMTVQVTPTSWTARCSQHGETPTRGAPTVSP